MNSVPLMSKKKLKKFKNAKLFSTGQSLFANKSRSAETVKKKEKLRKIAEGSVQLIKFFLFLKIIIGRITLL